MSDSLSRLDATQNYLQKNGMSFDELLVRAGDGKRLDAPVSAKELSSLKEKVLALIALSGDNDEYSISSLKAKVADNGGKLPDCVRMLLLSGAFGPLLLAVAKGLLAEGLLTRNHATAVCGREGFPRGGILQGGQSLRKT